jgi:DMSO/TMAO reductase YedYZ molybdopterin-dependent catalytic subunit
MAGTDVATEGSMTELPPGQRARDDMPAFGLSWYAPRMPSLPRTDGIRVTGFVAPFVLTADDLAAVARRTQMSDFHCVTTWSRPGARWSGVRFRDVYELVLSPRLPGSARVARVGFRGADGYCDSLPLTDLLADDVLLADQLDGMPLSRGNGAPLRLVAPAHYGYKNVKYVAAIELLGPASLLSRIMPSLHHPRARAAAEERFHGLPGPLVRYLYRPAIGLNVWWFQRMMRR